MAFKKPNLECMDCGLQMFEPSISHRKGGMFVDGKLVKCKNWQCQGERIKYIPKPLEGAPAFGRFSSASPDEKSKMLKQRSRAHYQKKVKDRAIEMNRNPLKYNKDGAGTD